MSTRQRWSPNVECCSGSPSTEQVPTEPAERRVRSKPDASAIRQQPGTDLRDRLSRLRHVPGSHLEHVLHLVPDLDGHVYPGGIRTLGEPSRVVEEDLVASALDAPTKQAVEVGSVEFALARI